MPLTENEKAIVKATLPTLEAAGPQLTAKFYKRMLDARPDVRALFNLKEQENGTQPRALAHALVCYAKYIDHLEAIGPVAAEIVDRHVSLDIKPEQYPIVGENLLATMKEMLGPEVATEEFLSAWTNAYFQLADMLIAAEAKEYERLAAEDGGWKDFRDFVVESITPEYEDVLSFHLVPSDGKHVIKHKAGQYLAIDVETSPGEFHRRNFSISSQPSHKGYRITVKKTGGPVSTYLHSLKGGEHINVLAPEGLLTIDSRKNAAGPVYLFAGGIGVTPLASMAAELAGTNIPTVFQYYAHGYAFGNQVAEWQKADNFSVKHVGSRPTAAEIDAVPKEADVYFVGPQGFMRSLYGAFKKRGFSADQIHFEFFGSNADIEA